MSGDRGLGLAALVMAGLVIGGAGTTEASPGKAVRARVASPVLSPTRGALSPAQITAQARAAGFRGRDLQVACAVALAESGGRPRTVYKNSDRYRSRDLGVWQINDYWNARWLRMGDWRDPATNARMAYSIWRERGWNDWVTYKRGRHARFMAVCGKAGR